MLSNSNLSAGDAVCEADSTSQRSNQRLRKEFLPLNKKTEGKRGIMKNRSNCYEPHCPSPTCGGRDRVKLYPIRGKPYWLPLEVWVSKKNSEILYRCACCGLVWSQERSKRPGLDARPIAYYDDFQHPWEFVSLKNRYRIREENTSRYWYSFGCQRDAIHSPKKGGVDWSLIITLSPTLSGRRQGGYPAFRRVPFFNESSSDL